MSCKIVGPLEIKNPVPPKLSNLFFKRLIAFYQLQPQVQDRVSFIWSEAARVFHKPLHEALLNGDRGAASALLDSVYHGCTMFGLDYGDNVLTDTGEEGIQAYKDHWLDLVQRAACSLGVIPVQNDEQVFDASHDASGLFCAMETVLGCPLTHTGGGGAFGIDVKGRFVPRKLLDAACVVGSVLRMQDDKRKLQTVYELGAGSGMLAGLMLRAFPSIRKYVINDLPLIAVIQAYLLAHVFTEDQIELDGETPKVNGPRISIMGQNEQVLPLGGTLFDLAINQDSMPEMPFHTQERYLLQIQQTLDDGAKFYSVNQESTRGGQLRVFCAAQKFPRLKLIQRSPYWGRSGYVEEVWEKR